MKKYFKFVAIFVLMIASATSWANYAILYKDTNFNINAGSLFASSYDNSYRVVGVDNDSFSSVIVSTGTCLVVFKDSDYRGDHIFFPKVSIRALEPTISMIQFHHYGYTRFRDYLEQTPATLQI